MAKGSREQFSVSPQLVALSLHSARHSQLLEAGIDPVLLRALGLLRLLQAEAALSQIPSPPPPAFTPTQPKHRKEGDLKSA